MSVTKCNRILKDVGEAYPRTCETCGLGPCHYQDYIKGQKYPHIRVLIHGKADFNDAFSNLIKAFCDYQNLKVKFEFDSKEVLKYSKGRSKVGLLFQDKFHDNFFSFIKDFENSGLRLC